MKGSTLTSYITGFVSSVILTLAAYATVVMHAFSSQALLSIILVLALLQLTVQLFFFLHLSFKSEERAKTIVFLLTLPFFLIIVVGSIWIMNHLNYNMSPDQITQYMNDQQGGF